MSYGLVYLNKGGVNLKKISIKRNILCDVADELSIRETIILGEVSAGYPAEAYNYIEDGIDLNKYVLGLKDDHKFKNKEGREVFDGKNRKHIKCVWATNKNMIGECIAYGDLIVIDTQKKPNKNSIILFYLDDEFVLKRCAVKNDCIELYSIDEDREPTIYQGEDLSKIGVVTRVVKKFPCPNNHYNGYPEDASSFIASGMDFNHYIIGDNFWETFFYLKAGGDSMIGDGISKGDLLIVDKLRDHYEDSIIVFNIQAKFTLKRFVYEEDKAFLVSSNPLIKPIPYKAGNEIKRWGVLTASIKKYT